MTISQMAILESTHALELEIIGLSDPKIGPSDPTKVLFEQKAVACVGRG